MLEVPYVRKEGMIGNSRGGYSFAAEADLIAKLRPVMLKHGIIGPIPVECRWVETIPLGKGSLMLGTRKFKFIHVPSGESETVEVFAEAADSYDKRAAKAMTLAKKYALREFFLVETGDDPDYVVLERDADNAEMFARACTAIRETKSVVSLDELWTRIEGYADAGWTEDQLTKLKTLKKERSQQLK